MPEIRRGAERFRTEGDGVSTWHSFSYGAHYDPDNVGFGPIIAINTERVEPSLGYDAHFHADVEIVTWVLEGSLRHEDTTGHRGVIRPGTAQRLSAGTGVQHTEMNDSAEEPLVFVQMMLASDHTAEPTYVQADVESTPGQLTPTVDVNAPAELFVARLGSDHTVTVPPASRSLVHVTRGSVSLGDAVLTSGDEARLTDRDAYDLSGAGDDGGEVLIWQLRR
jgi:redox-sensitive bicupin YhaK (pirin superfamily)